MSGDVQLGNINIYDYDQGCHISGNGNNGDFSIYHYGDSHHINLKIEGNKFSDMITVRLVILKEL